MINPSHTDPMWLIPKKKVGPAFDLAMIDVRHRFWRLHNSVSGGRHREALLALNDLGSRPFLGVHRLQVEKLLTCCFSANDQREAIVKEIIPSFPKARIPQLCSIMKIAFLRLWIEKQIILPLGWSSPINCDLIVDEMIREQVETCPLLVQVRAINPVSSLGYTGAMAEKNRDLRATYWLRILLASNLYNTQNFNAETVRDLKLRSFGYKSELARYYTDDFSLFVAETSNDPLMRDTVHNILEDSRAQLLQARKLNDPVFKSKTSSTARDKMTYKTLEYLEGDIHSIASFANIFNDARDMNKAFKIDGDDALPGGLTLLPDKVINFCKMISSTYQAFLRSRRLENVKNHKSSLYFLIAYCGPYLYKFFMNRDGHLEQYPTTFNDFTCALYITADHDLLKDLAVFEKEPPETLLHLIETLVDLNQWTSDTHYQRIYPIEGFFDYIISQSELIPNCGRVRNSFSPDSYPKLQKRWGTIKKPIPRPYFSTFVSMLDSLEYLTMHLNDMADGTTNGVVAGVLKCPNISELSHSSDWAGLWGIEGMNCACLDFSALNYSPIFYYEGKPRPFKYIPRFYRISDIEINGKVEPRIIMNDVRVTQLMCETGIRQQHLLWLDVDRYGNYVERPVRRPLAPLLISSDKAHGEWTAIVSSRVIAILDRQHAWYRRCTSSDYKQKIWYNLNKGSKFGQYRPLFRLPLTPSSWANYDAYRLLLLCLQYFIKSELDDQNVPDLVWTKSLPGEPDEPVYITDNSIAGLTSVTASTLTSDYTPHGLRAGFVSEAIKFLPPSIVGQWLTGQSEPLVSYYSVFDENDLGMTHQQMLCSALMSNQDKLSAGDFPELAQAIAKINRTLHDDIAQNPVAAITKHRLMSLSNAKREMDTGLDRIIAKEVSELAFNHTHICPFNNTCPKEVIDLFGEVNCCSACPYAIRGVAHLPAVSARKDKYKELMVGSLKVIERYLTRKPEARTRTELEQLEQENDRFAREACLLEAIEHQLVQMYESGLEQELMVKNKEEIVVHYNKLDLPGEERLLKRLIDVQNFPDTSSEDLNIRLSHLRHALLMREGNLSALLGIGEDNSLPLASKVALQISSMVKSGAIDVFELYAASTGEHEAIKRLATVANDAPKLIQMVA